MDSGHPIARLGGAKYVAAALRARDVKVADVTVRSWTLRGRSIPAKYWTQLAAVANERGIRLSLDELARRAAMATHQPTPTKHAA